MRFMPKSQKARGFLMFGLLAITISMCSIATNDEAPRGRPEGNGIAAYIAAQDFVKQNLKSPASVEWPGMFDAGYGEGTPLGEDRYLVNSWVDAQNGFGALIRNRYSAIVREEDEDRWVLEALKFSE